MFLKEQFYSNPREYKSWCTVSLLKKLSDEMDLDEESVIR
jgi:hypothetical protein